MTSRADNWSPLTLADWAAVFLAGFLAMFLLFFKFYAGRFAEEILAERNVELSLISLLAVKGTLPLIFGSLCLGALLAGLILSGRPGVRKGALWSAVALGATGLVGTLWGIYAPLL
ncbi:MAG: hypothetical protein AAFX94_05435 [Myxococcota bacterium]